MMKRIVPILVATALGCSTEVDLPLDLDRDTQPSPEETADSPPDDPPPPDAPPAPPAVGQLAWSRTDFEAPGYVHDIAWATDGGLLATVPMIRVVDGEEEQVRLLTRHAPDGTLDWDVHGNSNDYLGVLSATPGGGAVVAVSPEDWVEGPTRPAGLDWYDIDGNLTRSWRPADQDTDDMLREIDAVQAFPDGRVFWAGQTLNDDLTVRTSVAGLLDAEGQLEWLVTVPMPVDGDVEGQPAAAALTADGDIVLLVSYLPPSDDFPSWSSFVVRFALDGSETWRSVFLGSGNGNGIAVAPSGNLVVAGNFEDSVTIGDLDLEDDSSGHHHFVAELDPAGQAVGLNNVAVPGSIDSDEIGVLANTMTMIGSDLVLAGMYYTFSSDSPQLSGYYISSNRLDGDLVAEMTFPVVVSEPLFGFGPIAADATPEGRLALGGSFAGLVDFGDGAVDSGQDDFGPITLPFILAFDPPDPGCNDVD